MAKNMQPIALSIPASGLSFSTLIEVINLMQRSEISNTATPVSRMINIIIPSVNTFISFINGFVI